MRSASLRRSRPKFAAVLWNLSPSTSTEAGGVPHRVDLPACAAHVRPREREGRGAAQSHEPPLRLRAREQRLVEEVDELPEGPYPPRPSPRSAITSSSAVLASRCTCASSTSGSSTSRG